MARKEEKVQHLSDREEREISLPFLKKQHKKMKPGRENCPRKLQFKAVRKGINIVTFFGSGIKYYLLLKNKMCKHKLFGQFTQNVFFILLLYHKKV